MCQLLETIKVKDNRLQNLDYHNFRVNYSRRALFHARDKWDLSQLIAIPSLEPSTLYRCRFLYSIVIDHVEFLPYSPRLIQKLYLVRADDLDYAFKYADRTMLEKLRNNITQEANADILIVKDGFVTDTSFSNIAFFDGSAWVTSATPLLKGTKRAYYLQNGVIREESITAGDISKFKKARLINAMLDLETGTDIDVENIIRNYY